MRVTSCTTSLIFQPNRNKKSISKVERVSKSLKISTIVWSTWRKRVREKHTVNLGSIKVFVLQSLDAAPTSDNELFAITVMSTQLCERAKTAEEIYEGMCVG